MCFDGGFDLRKSRGNEYKRSPFWDYRSRVIKDEMKDEPQNSQRWLLTFMVSESLQMMYANYSSPWQQLSHSVCYFNIFTEENYANPTWQSENNPPSQFQILLYFCDNDDYTLLFLLSTPACLLVLFSITNRPTPGMLVSSVFFYQQTNPATGHKIIWSDHIQLCF
jgi:hypothetical protein